VAWQICITAQLLNQMTSRGGLSPTMLTVVQITVLGSTALVYLLVPLLLATCYQGKHVRATVNWLDPQPRWTDRCPLPVLALGGPWAWGTMSAIAEWI